jgi:hypothetical protein
VGFFFKKLVRASKFAEKIDYFDTTTVNDIPGAK